MSDLPYKIRVVSSYIYKRADVSYADMGKQNRWVNGFVSALVRRKSGMREFDLQFVRTPDTHEELCVLADEFRREGVQMLICPGTDSAIRVAAAVQDLPIIYFGAHPENNGLELIEQRNVTGIRLNLPMIWNWENFKLIKEVMPKLRKLYFPLNLRSEFAFPNVRSNYRLFRARGDAFWIPGDSTHIGYRSVAFLADRLGVEYFEGPYDSLAELESGLSQADTTHAAFTGFNDTVLQGAAAAALIGFTREHNQPLLWVNNAAIIQREGLLDYSSDFEGVGKIVGTMALDFLREGRPFESLGFREDPGHKTALSLWRCRELGLEVPQATVDKMNQVFA